MTSSWTACWGRAATARWVGFVGPLVCWVRWRGVPAGRGDSAGPTHISHWLQSSGRPWSGGPRLLTCARAPHLTPAQVYKGSWRGSVVAVKVMILPAGMSGKERREKMAVMVGRPGRTLGRYEIGAAARQQSSVSHRMPAANACNNAAPAHACCRPAGGGHQLQPEPPQHRAGVRPGGHLQGSSTAVKGPCCHPGPRHCRQHHAALPPTMP